MRKFKADYVFPISANPIKNGIITVNDQGGILAIDEEGTCSSTSADLETVSGIICPGFINTHCHLELSHLKDKISRGGGLVKFIKDVQKIRNTGNEEILAAAEKADQEMYDNGIVAVGDISNSAITAGIKLKSKIYYHTFVETFGFTPVHAEEIFNKALAIAKKFAPYACAVTPHAPYSVSKDLFKLFKKHGDASLGLISMHNQESEAENKLFRYKTGDFVDLYAHFGINISFFKPQACSSLQSTIPLLSNKQHILLVHNTFTSLKDIFFAKRFDRKISWCFCPNANLYIQNRLPKIEIFRHRGLNITLGTDSLASNAQLSVLDEMRVLQVNFPQLELNTLLTWATLNGAKFLEIDKKKGTLEVGKSPGLNLISGLKDLKFTPDTSVRRLI